MKMCGLSLKENIALRCFRFYYWIICLYFTHFHAAGAFSLGNQPSKQPEAHLKQGNLLEQMRCILSILLTRTNKHSWLEIRHFHAFSVGNFLAICQEGTHSRGHFQRTRTGTLFR